MRSIVTRFLVLPLLMFLASLAIAQTPQVTNPRDQAKEKAIWEELEKAAPKAPLLVESFKAATEALDKNDFPTAIQGFETVLQAVPDFDAAQRRLGLALIESGSVIKGTELLETAYARNASPENSGALARALAFPGDQTASKTNQKRALELVNGAARLHPSDVYYQSLRAQIALTLDDALAFRDAQENLLRFHPDLMQAHLYTAIRAAGDSDWEKAEAEIKQAQALGLPDEVVQSFLDSGVHTRVQVWHFFYWSLYLVGAWLVGLVGLFVLGKLFSNLTLRSIEEADPNGAASDKEVSLRSWYRRLINFAGVYYYISLPIVIFLLLAVVASIIYGFLMLGRIPIKLALILVIGALVTLYHSVRSLFIKIDGADPGRALQPEEAPGLWELTREVAQAVGTRPIDEIRITPGCDMAVYEKGSFRDKLHDRAKRILILGAGALNGMQQNAFRAVLAHEYGHFSHRDTAGGDVALRVEQDMSKFAISMAYAGQAVWYNIAYQFLRIYHFIFRRLSHGATRLQEVLADRVAVRNYGAAAFEEGLRHVIRRDVEFEFVASREIEAAQQAQRSLNNLYHLPDVKGSQDETLIEDSINKVITRDTTEDDTHPSPVDRFRLASRIAFNKILPPNAPVWDLFANREALTTELSALIDQRVREATT